MLQDTFFTVLKDKFPNLLTNICKKKYTLLVPMRKFIAPTMLIQNFYDNHIFYVSPYDPNIYINLNGKSLIFKDSTFRAHLCWKTKDIEFKIKEKVILDLGSPFGSIEYLSIDNVCDDTHFNLTMTTIGNDTKSTSSSSSSTVKTCSTSDEYVKHYSSYAESNPEYRGAERRLIYFVNLMKNNYIFIKDQEAFYYKKFVEFLFPLIDLFKTVFAKTKVDEMIQFTVVHELIESLIFNKYGLYDSIMGNLIMFSNEEEKYLSEKVKESKNEYNLAFLLGPQYKDCHFTVAIEKMKQLSSLKTHFEKFKLLSEINDMINKEVSLSFKQINNNKEAPVNDGNAYLSYWTYILSQCEWNNFIAEINFIYNFHFFSCNLGGSSYFITMLNGALDKIKKDIYKNEPPRFSLTQNIGQSTIITQAINPLKVTEYSA